MTWKCDSLSCSRRSEATVFSWSLLRICCQKKPRPSYSIFLRTSGLFCHFSFFLMIIGSRIVVTVYHSVVVRWWWCERWSSSSLTTTKKVAAAEDGPHTYGGDQQLKQTKKVKVRVGHKEAHKNRRRKKEVKWLKKEDFCPRVKLLHPNAVSFIVFVAALVCATFFPVTFSPWPEYCYLFFTFVISSSPKAGWFCLHPYHHFFRPPVLHSLTIGPKVTTIHNHRHHLPLLYNHRIRNTTSFPIFNIRKGRPSFTFFPRNSCLKGEKKKITHSSCL